MGKVLNVEFRLSKGQESPTTFFTSSVNEDLAGVGAGQKGTLAALLSLTGEGDFKERAQELVKKFEEEYLKPRDGSILNSLEAALKNLQEETREENLILEMSATVVWGLVLYVGKIGEAEIFLSREKINKPIKFKFVASGMLADGDTLTLVNSNFSKAVGQEELSLIMGRESLEEVKSKLDQVQETLKGSACLLLRMKLQEAEIEEVPLAFVDADNNFEGRSVKDRVNQVFTSLVPYLKKIKVVLDPWLEKLKRVLAKYAGKLYGPWRKKKPGEVFDEKARQKLRLFEIGLVLVLILVLSLSFSFLKSKNQEKSKKFQSLVSQVKEKISQASENLLLDPSLGQIQITEAKNLLSQAEKLSETSETNNLEQQLNDLEKESQRIYQPQALKQFADLSNLDFSSSKMVLRSGFLVALDSRSNSLAKISLSSKKSSSISVQGKEFENLASLGNDLYLLTDKEVWSLNSANNSLNRILSGEAFGPEIVDNAIYSSNFYLLDKNKKQIWKYLKFGSSLTSARSYFTSTPPDLSQATSLAIDGSVWIGTEEGKIYKFLTGKREEFELFGGPENLTITRLFTDEQTKNLYVLDGRAGRVVIFDKAGEYLASYESSEITAAGSFVVSEKEKTIYFSRDAKIFSFKIR